MALIFIDYASNKNVLCQNLIIKEFYNENFLIYGHHFDKRFGPIKTYNVCQAMKYSMLDTSMYFTATEKMFHASVSQKWLMKFSGNLY